MFEETEKASLWSLDQSIRFFNAAKIAIAIFKV